MPPSPWLSEQKQSICEHVLCVRLCSEQIQFNGHRSFTLTWIWMFLIGFNVNITNDYKKVISPHVHIKSMRVWH